jgi:hypothetical protein
MTPRWRHDCATSRCTLRVVVADYLQSPGPAPPEQQQAQDEPAPHGEPEGKQHLLPVHGSPQQVNASEHALSNASTMVQGLALASRPASPPTGADASSFAMNASSAPWASELEAPASSSVLAASTALASAEAADVPSEPLKALHATMTSDDAKPEPRRSERGHSACCASFGVLDKNARAVAVTGWIRQLSSWRLLMQPRQ